MLITHSLYIVNGFIPSSIVAALDRRQQEESSDSQSDHSNDYDDEDSSDQDQDSNNEDEDSNSEDGRFQQRRWKIPMMQFPI